MLSEMDATDAKRWMKLCCDSGLWVPTDKSVLEDDHVDDEDQFQDGDEAAAAHAATKDS